MRAENKHEYFIDIAHVVASRSPCLSRKVGCVLVDDVNHIIATGYSGPPRGIAHCQICHRKVSGQDLYTCSAVHAEANALLQCNDVFKIYAAYITINPCNFCMRLLANTSCQLVVFSERYTDDSLLDFLDFWTNKLGREAIYLKKK